MTTLKFILLSFIGIIANFSTYAHSSAPIVRSNVHKEWVYIIKCNELQANQYSKFEKLLAKSTVMKQSEDEIILLVSQSVIALSLMGQRLLFLDLQLLPGLSFRRPTGLA